MGDSPVSQYPWCHSADDVAKAFAVDTSKGLSTSEVAERRSKYGYNELEKEPPTPLWKLVLAQFDDLLVKILLAAAAVSLLLAFFDEDTAEEGLRAFIEPAVILLILLLNAIVGVWQESNAEAALEALKDMQSEHAKTLRSGRWESDLLAKELVPGDIVELHVGDKAPADLRLLNIRTATLRADQSALTGESKAVLKSTQAIAQQHVELQSKECMLFAGTAIANGTCTAIVTGTGMATEIGKIQEAIQAAKEEEADTPLKQKLDEFGEWLAKVIFYICATVWLMNIRHFITWQTLPDSVLPDMTTVRLNVSKCTYYFKIAVALAVAAIPEGLPAVITTCLALGTRKMAKQNAIVRKLPSVETLGCTTVICSDKTGTLTTNQMSATLLVGVGATPSTLRQLKVSGTSYDPDDGAIQGVKTLDANLATIAQVCALCNESRVECKEAGVFKCVGAPTEAALLVLSEKLAKADSALQSHTNTTLQRKKNAASDATPACTHYANVFRKVATLEFDRQRKSMSVICSNAARKNVLLVKGAPECVLDRCTHIMLQNGEVVALDATARREVLKTVKEMAGNALRCLSFAMKDLRDDPLASYSGDNSHAAHKLLTDPANYESVESGLTFLGLAGLQDPPRVEVADAIRACHTAGIRVIVITGDNIDTAEAVCRSIGVFNATEPLAGKSLTGTEFSRLSKSEQLRVLSGNEGKVFSRAEPGHKQDIVRLLREMDEVIAMTGDGVNDAPALKLADIGIAMGITGTEVAKEASDMVLADDNFATIVAAVCEGRSIYDNMKAFIRYMISSNIGEVASIFLTAAAGLPEGLIPVQLLWVNLVTDGPPATALGFNPPDKDAMRKPPRRKDDGLINGWVFARYLIIGAYVGFATVGIFVVWFLQHEFLGIDLSGDGHSTVTWHQLTHWQACPTWKDFNVSKSYTAGNTIVHFNHPCDYFDEGKLKPSTLSLSVLVLIEMLNALNALSENNSLLTMPPWCNPWLLVAAAVSLGLHCLVMYVPVLASIFWIVPLSLNEWLLVFVFSCPVILIDEVLKLIGRLFFMPVAKVKSE